MKRLLFALLAFAPLITISSCESGDRYERHPGVRLRRSDHVYANENYGDPARRRERRSSQPFRSAGGKLQRFFTGRDTISH
jgi:hypothetical protein